MEAYLKDLFDTIYLHSRELTAGQLDFIESCKRQYKKYGTISDKQISVLKDIKKSLSGSQTAPRYSMKVN